MGGHVADDLSGALITFPIILPTSLPVVFNSLKPFSSGLHKKFVKSRDIVEVKGSAKMTYRRQQEMFTYEICQ